jgi:hypothetical protein
MRGHGLIRVGWQRLRDGKHNARTNARWRAKRWASEPLHAASYRWHTGDFLATATLEAGRRLSGGLPLLQECLDPDLRARTGGFRICSDYLRIQLNTVALSYGPCEPRFSGTTRYGCPRALVYPRSALCLQRAEPGSSRTWRSIQCAFRTDIRRLSPCLEKRCRDVGGRQTRLAWSAPGSPRLTG